MTEALSVVEQAKKYMRLAVDADGGNRQAAIDDLEFSYGKQWPAAIELSRQLEQRPCLTINKTDTFVRSVLNNMRQQRPRVKVHPVGSGSDIKTAEVLQGLIRHIEVNSNADLAYDTAADYQVRMGWGYWRVLSKYIADDSFDQELYIERIRNPFSVYFDPSSTSPDGSDAKWCLITERMTRDSFKAQYPNADPLDFQTLGAGDEKALWATRTEIVVAEMYRIVETPDMLCMLNTGAKAYKSDLPKPDIMAMGGLQVVNERHTVRRVVKWSKITARTELETVDLKGKYIPVVPVYGSEMISNGQVMRFGMVRQLKDPARMYNFWRTAETEVIALAPKAPWLMADGQDEGHEDEWANANNKSYSSLKYKPITGDDGQPLPPPQRQQPQSIPAGQVHAAMAASEDLKAVAGMFDPALGAPGNETSGKMVNARQGQSDLSNFHFYDNLTRSISQTGKILLDLIPAYYDTERVVRIIGDDEQPKAVTLNDKSVVGKILNDMAVGLYDVVMDTGPGYQTKRQEAAAGMLEMLKTELGKQVGQVAGDIVVRQFDIPGIADIADRLAAANPLATLNKMLPEDLPHDAKQFIAKTVAELQKTRQMLQELQQEKAAKMFGDKQWIDFEREKIGRQQQGENQRLLAKEHAENERQAERDRSEHERAALSSSTKIHDTNTRAQESWREALLDAHTDLALGKDRGPQNDTE
jgi:hypothetical protein